MRSTLTVLLVVVALGGQAAAQSHRSSSTADVAQSSVGLPLPTIGLPLPQIGLPLPPTGLSPLPAERPDSIFRSANRGDRPPRDDRRGPRSSRRGNDGAVFVYGWPGFGWPYYPQELGAAVPGPPSPPEPPRATGWVRIEVQPEIDPQVYVDDFYVGLLSEAGIQMPVDAGQHTLELREDGYEPIRMAVHVGRDAIVTYRGRLIPIDGAPVQEPTPLDVVPPIPPTTFYVIPGCYVGNVRPTQADLPAGCDARDALVIPSRR